MTAEAERFLETADDHLERGLAMVAACLNYDAGRAAYLAAFHAAQAMIFERTGRTVKTHKGVNIEFLRLTKHDWRLAPDQRGFLSQAYNFKAVADYDTGAIAVVSSQQAVESIEISRKFVATIRHMLTPPELT